MLARSARSAPLLGICLAAALVLGCALSRSAGAQSAATELPPDDRAPLEWAREEPYVLVVHRSCRTMNLYRYGEWVRRYDKLSFGPMSGAKVEEGDRRTPRGLYMIVGKRHHPRWARFMLLDYPTPQDRRRHQVALAAGRAGGSPGGQVGIHGSDKPRLNELGIDWTFGCVSMSNEDVIDLYDQVEDGTLVLIDD